MEDVMVAAESTRKMNDEEVFFPWRKGEIVKQLPVQPK
jgi:hypothetical protein